MKGNQSKNLLWVAIAAAAAMVLQVIGLVRYLGRLPDDTVGIVLYVIAAVAFTISAVFYAVRWYNEK